MALKLDSYDKRILYELDRNARITTSQIGKLVRKSKQFVDYRIKNLESQKAITGYTSVIDYSRLGYLSIRVYLKFHKITPEQQARLESDLIKDKEVWWLVTTEGIWDVCYATAVQNVLEFYDYWDKIMKKYRKFVSNRSIVIYTHIRQFPKSYLIGKENLEGGTLTGASKEKISVEKFDIGLLRLISDKARMPLIEIARRLRTSPQVVRNHLKKLEKERIILGYRALIDVSLLGYRYFKAYINFSNTLRLDEFEAFCSRHPNMLNLNRTIGGRDFEIEMQARSFDEFEKIMNELRVSFSDMIDDYEWLVAREEKKMTYFPFE